MWTCLTSPTQMTSGPENSAAFLCKISKCLPLCIIQFQVAALDNDFPSTPKPMSIMVAWWFFKQYHLRAQWRVPLIPWIFSQYYELWMVNNLNSCAEKHCLWTDWQFSHDIWNKVVNHDPCLLAKIKPLVDAPFILNLDNLTCYQVKC